MEKAGSTHSTYIASRVFFGPRFENGERITGFSVQGKESSGAARERNVCLHSLDTYIYI